MESHFLKFIVLPYFFNYFFLNEGQSPDSIGPGVKKDFDVDFKTNN